MQNNEITKYDMRMKNRLICFALLSALLFSCEKKEQADSFDYSVPVDLSYILEAYDWQQTYEGDDMYELLKEKIFAGMPEDESCLIEDTSFVLRVPEHRGSQQPFLKNAEDFYNSCSLSWDIYSNYEVWFRGHTANFLSDEDDNDIKQSIRNISVNIIRDKDVQQAAQLYKDSILLLMETTPDEWDEDISAMDYVVAFGNVIESKAYMFYDDEEAFVTSLDSVIKIAEEMASDRFQRYMEASEEKQLEVMLGELAACKNFDEQCSLWRHWANCEKSSADDEWILSVGIALMKSGKYSPILHHIWITWRALCQTMFFGSSRDSVIPNQYYNEFRRMCYVACLKRIETHPDDVFAMNCAAAIGGRTNMNRFGQYYFGNEAMIESYMMMPLRYDRDDSDEE
jgi:hypothetical protein